MLFFDSLAVLSGRISKAVTYCLAVADASLRLKFPSSFRLFGWRKKVMKTGWF